MLCSELASCTRSKVTSNSGQEFFRIDGLPHEVIGTDIQSSHSAFDVISGGNQQDRGILTVLSASQRWHQTESIPAWHADVAHNHIWCPIRNEKNGVVSPAGAANLVALVIEQRRKGFPRAVFIFNDQNSSGRFYPRAHTNTRVARDMPILKALFGGRNLSQAGISNGREPVAGILCAIVDRDGAEVRNRLHGGVGARLAVLQAEPGTRQE